MLYEITERLVAIIEGSELGISTYRYLPAALDDGLLPSAIILPRQDAGFEYDGAARFLAEPVFDVRLYITPVGMRLESINQIEPLKYLDLFADVFLSRPQLQWNNQSLSGVVGNLSFRNTSNLSRPIEYPIGFNNAPRYWGATYQLVIPYRSAIALKPAGV